MVRVAVVGASGYAGGEIIRYLIGHPEAEITCLASDTYAGKHIGSAFPSLLGLDLPACEPFGEKMLGHADVFFLAQQHGFAMEAARGILDAGKKVIDISADFRLKDAHVFEQWYKTPHTATDVLRRAVYGLPELARKSVRTAALVANPGCYPTGALLALAPAVEAGIVDPTSIIVDSKSGVSGAGRSKFELGYLFSEVDECLKPYGVSVHRHTPEIEQELSGLAGRDVRVSFTPHLVPMIRGILTTAYASLAREVTTAEVIEIYVQRYADSPFVVVLGDGEYPATKSVAGSNYCHVGLKVDQRTDRLVAMSAIDNMGKGAAGQAVQNMNLMFELPETLGIERPAVYP